MYGLLVCDCALLRIRSTGEEERSSEVNFCKIVCLSIGNVDRREFVQHDGARNGG